MNREQKIEAIYEKIADKTLSFGCKVLINYWRTFNEATGSEFQGDACEEFLYLDKYHVYDIENKEVLELFRLGEKNNYAKIVKVFFHPVMIGDVLDYMENKYFKILTEEEIGYEEYKKPGIPYGIKEDNLKKIFKVGKFYGIWYNKRKSLEEQSDECIDYIYNLLGLGEKKL